MKTFNKAIQITVEVDTIAANLLKTFSEDFAHRELLTEAIIGTAIHKNTLGDIYGALCGFTGDINFKVGDNVTTTDITTQSNYEGQTTTSADAPTTYTYKNRNVGAASIVDIDLYADRKVQIMYSITDRYGKPATEKQWVSHKHLSGVEPMKDAVKEILTAVK